jgi:hypothetical protein
MCDIAQEHILPASHGRYISDNRKPLTGLHGESPPISELQGRAVNRPGG